VSDTTALDSLLKDLWHIRRDLKAARETLTGPRGAHVALICADLQIAVGRAMKSRGTAPEGDEDIDRGNYG